MLLICSPSGHPRCRWLFFFSRTVKKIFSWNCGPWWFIKCKSAATKSQKSISRNTKLYPFLLPIYWGLMKRKDQSVQDTEHYLQHYLPVIQSLRQTGKYDYFPQTDSFGPFVSMNWFNSLVHLPEWLIHHRIIYATILAHFESEWLSGVWKWVLIEWIELVDLCYSSHELFQMFSPIWWTASTSSLKRTSSKEWFLHELNITPDRLPEALDYSYIML